MYWKNYLPILDKYCDKSLNFPFIIKSIIHDLFMNIFYIIQILQLQPQSHTNIISSSLLITTSQTSFQLNPFQPHNKQQP